VGVVLTPYASRGPLQVLACVLLAILAWSGSIVRGGFAFDDREATLANPVVTGALGARAAFERDYWEHLGPAGHYRPLATLALRADRALWGERPAGWHLTNVVLHALCVALLGFLLLLLGPTTHGDALPWAGLAVFAVHPALADAVAWISGRTSLVSAAGGLAGAVALLALGVPWRAPSATRSGAAVLASALGLAFALLGKEDGVVFAPLYLLLALRHSRRMAVASALGCAVGIGLVLALRAHALDSPWPKATHLPSPLSDSPARLLIGGRAVLEGLRLVAFPAGYPPSYERSREFAPDAQLLALKAALGWLFWIALVAAGLLAARRRPRSTVAWSAALAALCVAPVLQFVPAGALFAPRWLYLPLAFGAVLVHAGWRAAGAALPSGRARMAVATLLLGLCVLGAWWRAGVYAGRGSFAEAVLAHEPRDAPAWNDLGLAREEEGDLAGARAAFERSAALDPLYSRPWSNLGRFALESGDLAAAEVALRRAADLGPRNPVAQVNLGSLLLRLGQFRGAETSYRRAIELAPGMGAAWRGLGRALEEQGRRGEAREALRRALACDPADRAARAALERLDARDEDGR